MSEDVREIVSAMDRLAKAMHELAGAMEQENRRKRGPWNGEMHRVSPDEWARLGAAARAWAYVDE